MKTLKRNPELITKPFQSTKALNISKRMSKMKLFQDKFQIIELFLKQFELKKLYQKVQAQEIDFLKNGQVQNLRDNFLAKLKDNLKQKTSMIIKESIQKPDETNGTMMKNKYMVLDSVTLKKVGFEDSKKEIFER